MSKPNFICANVVLPVRSISEAVNWYAEALGFSVAYLHEGEHEGEEANYAILQRDDVSVHFILDEGYADEHPWTQSGTGYLYLVVNDVDKVFEEVKAKGIAITRDLQIENWGARGFNLTDPSGNDVHIEQPR